MLQKVDIDLNQVNETIKQKCMEEIMNYLNKELSEYQAKCQNYILKIQQEHEKLQNQYREDSEQFSKSLVQKLRSLKSLVEEEKNSALELIENSQKHFLKQAQSQFNDHFTDKSQLKEELQKRNQEYDKLKKDLDNLKFSKINESQSLQRAIEKQQLVENKLEELQITSQNIINELKEKNQKQLKQAQDEFQRQQDIYKQNLDQLKSSNIETLQFLQKLQNENSSLQEQVNTGQSQLQYQKKQYDQQLIKFKNEKGLLEQQALKAQAEIQINILKLALRRISQIQKIITGISKKSRRKQDKTRRIKIERNLRIRVDSQKNQRKL
ncbi:unnamed protein product (macronuclear) [Paramecium tetraurelia]|uniref:Uncharacterized protein n=1 Tax=Paramecium tetraurelia TaxID=5888 RepID=A0D874_PARTE|nr:uncharacterized protein GSPATT00014208001 [Paramecium tetraurelia]CAK79241.1 unnamed protein product [Paramecium tetraurelia]|eukprot:XP_001446638.1 hypothetical protein (macronuclear) [Paramecium tetraurelia strain d4-2]